MSVLTPEEFNKQEAMAIALENARILLLRRIKALAPAERGLSPDEDDSRRLQFADDFLREVWNVRALGPVQLGRTPDECDELLPKLQAALGQIDQLVQDWLQRRSARR